MADPVVDLGWTVLVRYFSDPAWHRVMETFGSEAEARDRVLSIQAYAQLFGRVDAVRIVRTEEANHA